MTPRIAARNLVKIALSAAFMDVMMLTEPEESPVEAEQKTAYAGLVREVRKACGYSVKDLDIDRLYDAVLAAVPEEYRAALHAAFNAYHDARTAQLVVIQATAYRIGLEVRHSLSRRGAQVLMGDGGVS